MNNRVEKISSKLRKGDTVVVLAGKNKGIEGTIDKLDLKKGRVYVTNTNLAKRHTRPDVGNPSGGIIEKAMPLPISNVAFVDPKTKKPTRLGYKTQNGQKVRFSKKSGAIL